MEIPLVSIALCTYNGEDFLADQLNSLVNQSYPNLEIIVTDDCSSDRTLEILSSYRDRYPFLRIVENEKNLGYIKNFEKAITLCNGDYIALCDQDDIWDLEKIKLQVEKIGDSLLNYHDSAFIKYDGSPINKKMSDLLNMYEGSSYRPFLLFNCVSGHACLFKKELVKYSLPFPKGVFHDRWLAYVATNLGSITYLNQPLVKYRQHEKSDTNILKLERAQIKKDLHGVQKIKNALVELDVMKAFAFNKEQDFVDKLSYLYKKRLDTYFCPSLVFFMYKHYHTLLYISHKSNISKINFIFKHLWGYRLKATR